MHIGMLSRLPHGRRPSGFGSPQLHAAMSYLFPVLLKNTLSPGHIDVSHRVFVASYHLNAHSYSRKSTEAPRSGHRSMDCSPAERVRYLEWREQLAACLLRDRRTDNLIRLTG